MTDRVFLKAGAHPTLAQGGCAMEFVAWIAGEAHSDHPQCVSEVIGAFVRPVNDRLPDDMRQRLIPVLLDTVGTRTTPEDDAVRRWLAVDWAIRTALPWWLRNAQMDEWAVKVEAVAPVTDRESASKAREVVLQARTAANQKWNAYAAAAYAAAAYAADAAAAGAAAYAADAAAAAADHAVRRKFWEANLPSCLDLIRRMCAVGRKAEVEIHESRAALVRCAV